MKKVLIVSLSYPPAYHRGGPTRSVFGITASLQDAFTFSVICDARDLGSDSPMPGVTADHWVQQNEANVFYSMSLARLGFELWRYCRDNDTSVIYLNSLFDRRYTLLPVLVWVLRGRRSPLMLAPRGEMSPQALESGRIRKRALLGALRVSGLGRKILWHASSAEEAKQIRQGISQAEVRIAPSIPARPLQRLPARHRDPARVRLLFLGRISPLKNIDGLLRGLGLCGDINFELTLAGPIDSDEYWRECRELVRSEGLESSVTCVGAIDGESVREFVGLYDLLTIPSHSESFGHVAFEALGAGVPILVGATTMWATVPDREGAVYVCDSRSPDSIADGVRQFVRSRERDAELGPRAALLFAQNWYATSDPVSRSRELLDVS